MLTGVEHSEPETVEYWEHRYREKDRLWSGRPNDALVATVGGLPPGHALDLGCGEGGDALWLAENGWRVTAVDVTPTAVGRAREAELSCAGIDAPVDWVLADLSTWEPSDRYDLVSACFLHSPLEFRRAQVIGRAASAVSSGGYVLVVGHATAPPWATRHAHGEHRFLTPEEELRGLDLDAAEWETSVCEVRARRAAGPTGEVVTLEDAVVLLRRR